MQRPSFTPAAVAVVLAVALCALWTGSPRAGQNATGNIRADEAAAAARAAQETMDDTIARINDAKAEAIFGKRCTAPCHGARKTCLALGLKAKNGWDTTITMMQFKGVPIGAEEKKLLVEWLWDLPAQSSPPCE